MKSLSLKRLVKHKVGVRFLGVCCIALVMGCTKPISEPNDKTNGATNVGQSPSQFGSPNAAISANYDPAAVVADVNGQKITRGELENAFQTILVSQQARGQTVNPDQHPQVKTGVLEMLIDSTLAYQSEVKNYPEVPNDRIDKAIESVKAQYESEEAFYSSIMERGLTTEALRATAEIDIRNQLFMERLAKDINITEEDAAKTYKENEEMFNVPEQVSISHLLIAISPAADPETKILAFDKAKALRSRLRSEAGLTFEELVAKESDDERTKNDGGNIGSFYITDKPPEGPAGIIYEAVKPLAEGKVSAPIQTPLGLHLVKVTSRKPAHLPSFEDVKINLIKQLEREKIMEVHISKMKELRESADIKKYPLTN